MKKALVFLGILFSINSLFAQWTSTNGPSSPAKILSLFKTDSIIYSTSYRGGLNSRSDNDQKWNLKSPSYFTTYTLSGDSLWVDLHKFWGGMDRDEGIYLYNLSNPSAAPQLVRSFRAQSLLYGDTCIYGGTNEYGFFKMNFDGTNLQNFNNGLPGYIVYDPYGNPLGTIHNVLTVNKTDSFFFAGTTNGIYRSDLSLNNWVAVPGNSNFNFPCHVIKIINDTIYTFIGSAIFYSADNGNNWSQLFSSQSYITDFIKEDSSLYAGTENNGVFYSSDYGLTWSAINTGLPDLQIEVLLKKDSFIYCGTLSKGLFRYENGMWQDFNNGINTACMMSECSTNNYLLANTREKVYRMLPNQSWLDITPNVSNTFFSSLKSSNDTVFLSVQDEGTSYPYDRAFILYSSDFGSNWNSLINPVPFTGDDPYRIYYDGNTLYASEDEKIYSTNNLGLSWSNMNLPSTVCNNVEDFVVFHSIPFALACGPSQVMAYINNSWVLKNVGLSGATPRKLMFCDSAIFVHSGNTNNYVSFDNGNNWSYAGSGLVSGININDFAFKANKLFIATNKGVFGTENYGQNWYSLNGGLINLDITSLKIFRDTLFAGTNGSSVWKLDINSFNLSTLDVENTISKINIYPNPTSNYINIESQAFTNKNIVVVVLNAIGQEVFRAELKSFSGFERIDFKEMPSGVYILRIETDKEYAISKFIKNK